MQKTTPYKIFPATKDISMNCAYLISKFIEESDLNAIAKFDKDRTEQVLDFCIDSDLGCVFVASDGSKLIGIIVALANQLMFADELISTEVAWWVDPEYRGTSAGVRLMDEYEKWAKEKGCKISAMSVYIGVSNPKLGSLYERKGYEQTEVAYRKVLN